MKTQTKEQRIKQLRLILNDVTTSDLQGIAVAIALTYGLDDDELLSYAYGDIEYGGITQ